MLTDILSCINTDCELSKTDSQQPHVAKKTLQIIVVKAAIKACKSANWIYNLMTELTSSIQVMVFCQNYLGLPFFQHFTQYSHQHEDDHWVMMDCRSNTSQTVQTHKHINLIHKESVEHDCTAW